MKNWIKVFIGLGCFIEASYAKPNHGIAMHGHLKYPSTFTHFETVNPDAPKGGEIRLGDVGTFDSLNPFIIKGKAPTGISNLVFESLLVRSPDEPFSLYGLIAESLEIAPDRSWIIFTMNPKAKWHDGQPMTAKDVIFSYHLLREKGSPNRRLYYQKVEKAEILGDRKIKFTFKKIEGAYDREMPLIIGLMTILPEHHLKGQVFEKTGMKPLLGSGPYKIEKFEAGRSITYQRDPGYWGKDLAVRKGEHNFDKIHYLYFLNPTVAFEAFKSGKIDFKEETNPSKWATDYNFTAVKKGQVTREEISHEHQVGMHALVFNMRRPLFADYHVRLALNTAFDFEWINKNLYAGAFVRTVSYFDNTYLAAKGKPSDEELKLLQKFEKNIDSNLLEHPYSPACMSNEREAFRKALSLFDKAGWHIKNGKLVNKISSQPFQFEILIGSPDAEKIVLEYTRRLKRIGIDATVRLVDAAQYTRRQTDYDFDMIVYSWGHTLCPGNEQTFYWSSIAADKPGTRNYPGIKSPLVDNLCQCITDAKTKDDLVTATRALDRVLRSGCYIIPLGHKEKDYIAYWNTIEHPHFGTHGVPNINTWWSKKSS